MRTLATQSEMRTEVRAARARGRTVGLVPTMGAWHEGHLSLLRAARRGCDVVVATIYVNPLQFGPSEDLAAYPRRPEEDLELARRCDVDVVFVPPTEEMSPPGRAATVSPGPLGEVLEGAARPGHFEGVCTVVAQLFNIAEPDVAFFGAKDAQQVAVVRRMTADLSFGVRIESCPTVRDHDGLALSSRNVYLDDDERARAAVLYRALRAGAGAWSATRDARRAESEMHRVVAAQEGVDLDYARAVDPDTFGAPEPGVPPLLVIAARVGRARLIDNVACDGS